MAETYHIPWHKSFPNIFAYRLIIKCYGGVWCEKIACHSRMDHFRLLGIVDKGWICTINIGVVSIMQSSRNYLAQRTAHWIYITILCGSWYYHLAIIVKSVYRSMGLFTAKSANHHIAVDTAQGVNNWYWDFSDFLILYLSRRQSLRLRIPVRLRKSLKKSEKSQSQLFTPWHCLTGYGMKRMLSMWHSNVVHPTHSTAEFLTNERHIIAFLSPSCHTKPANIQILMDLIELIDNTITSPVTDNDYKSIMLNAIVEHNFALTTANHNRSVSYW